jgi:pimeloyl-ACP methyl ester carboxylesterase
VPASEWIDLPGRVKLSYVRAGDPSGIPVLLLHGVTDSWRSFEPVLPHLPASVNAIALSQRGHGDSERPRGGYRTRDYAADVAAGVDALGLDRPVVVGHSMGATNAQRFAIDHPDRLRGLVLAASFASYRRHPTVTDLCESVVARLEDPIDPAFVREFQEGTVARPVPAAFMDTVVRESLKVPARVWRATFGGFLEDDCVADLGRIRAPTLILWGDRDTLCRREDEDTLLHAIAGSRLVVYEGVGHAIHWEEPERFAADLVAFVHTVVG